MCEREGGVRERGKCLRGGGCYDTVSRGVTYLTVLSMDFLDGARAGPGTCAV